MAQANGVDMPIVSAVAAMLENRTSVEEAIELLLLRPVGAEASQ